MATDDRARWTPPSDRTPTGFADRTGYLLFFLGRFGVGAVVAALHLATSGGFGARPLDGLTRGLGFVQSALVWTGLLVVAVGLDAGHSGAAVLVILASIGTSAVFQATGTPAEIPTMAPTLVAFAAPTAVFGLALGASGRRRAMWAVLTLAVVGLLAQRKVWFSSLDLAARAAAGEDAAPPAILGATLALSVLSLALELAVWLGVAWLNPAPPAIQAASET